MTDFGTVAVVAAITYGLAAHALPMTRVGVLLARLGYRSTSTGALAPRRRRGIFRFLWNLQDCAYCAGVYVAGFAAWYTTGELWSKPTFVLWWAAWGAHALTVKVVGLAEEALALAVKVLDPPLEADE